MTPASKLLDDLTEIGAVVTLDGGRLLLKAGPQPVPKALIDRLRGRKRDLTAIFQPAPVIGIASEHDNYAGVAEQTVFEERAAIIEDGSDVPRVWAEGFARLDLADRPTGFTIDQWQRLIDDAGRFLDRWRSEAARLEWSTTDLFGVSRQLDSRNRPTSKVGRPGWS